MTVDSTTYLTVDQWVHLVAVVLAADPGDVRRTANLGLAESALHAPAAAFGDAEAYPELIDKAAVLGWHLTNNHPLFDGNKRTAFVAMVVFLKINGCSWNTPTAEDAVGIMLGVASKEVDTAALASWLRSHVT